MNGTAVSRGVNPLLTAIPGLSGTYAWPQITVNAGGQIIAISSLTTYTGNLTVTGTLNAGALVVTGTATFAGPTTLSGVTTISGKLVGTNTAGAVAGVFSTPSDSQVQINASGTGQYSTLEFTQNGVVTGQLFSDNVNGGLSLTVNNSGTGGLRINQGSGTISGQGPIAGAAVDMTPDRGTFTLTHNGFNAAVTSTATWYRIGNAIILNTGSVSGTSNATTWTATGLPAGLQSTLTQNIGISDLVDSGASTAGIVGVAANNGTLTFGKGAQNGGAFTNTGAKGFFNTGGTTFSYLKG